MNFALGDRNIQGDGGSLVMSTSYTTETVGTSVHDLLQAYNVHHSGTEEEVGSEAQSDVRRLQPQLNSPSVSSYNRISDSPPAQNNPDDVSSRRRVPPYRETSRDHDISQRVGGRDSTEAAVVQVMFFGVYIQGVGAIIYARERQCIFADIPQALNRVWRQTGGRINDKIFHYEVGGEW